MNNVNQIFYIKYRDNDGYITTLKDPDGYNALSDSDKQQFTQVVVDLKHLSGWGNYWDKVRYVNGALSYPSNYPEDQSQTIDDLKAKLNQSIDSNENTSKVSESLQAEIDDNKKSIEDTTNAAKTIDDKFNDFKNHVDVGENTLKANDDGSLRYNGQALVVATKGDAPAAPKLEATIGKGVLTYNIKPSSNEGSSKVFKYTIGFGKHGTATYDMRDASNLGGTIEGLDQNTTYDIVAFAYNSNGSSSASNMITTKSFNGKIYGVKYDPSKDTPNNLEYIDSAKGLSANYNSRDDFYNDKYSPWNLIRQINIMTAQYNRVGNGNKGSDTNDFICIPKCYIKKTATGNFPNTVYTWEVSTTPFPGSYLPDCFKDGNKTLPWVGVGRYFATADMVDVSNYQSDFDKMSPMMSSSMQNDANILGNNYNAYNDESLHNRYATFDIFQKLAKANGKGYQLLDASTYDVLQALITIEFATLNIGSMSGTGPVNYEGIVEGRNLDSVGENTAVTTEPFTPQFVNYTGNDNAGSGTGLTVLGIQDLVSMPQYIDGLNVSNGDNDIYYCGDTSKYQSNLYANPYHKVTTMPTGYGNNKVMGFTMIPNVPSLPIYSDNKGISNLNISYDFSGGVNGDNGHVGAVIIGSCVNDGGFNIPSVFSMESVGFDANPVDITSRLEYRPIND